MSQEAKPWFYKQTGWWMAWIDGRKEKLAKGKANKKAAKDRLDELRVQARKNPPLGTPQTIASVIETYQKFEGGRLAPSTMVTRAPFLQSFAEARGWKAVSECTPLDMRQWLNSHPEWKSDWTKNGALRNVQVAFNWAVENKLIPVNPFKGVTHRKGQPRRDMTPEEFRAILRATASHRRRKLTPGARFRQVLVFLYFTGCRPSEASHLEWKHVDFERGLIVLAEHKTARTQKVYKPRVIPMPAVVVRLLRSIEKRDEGERVFVTYRGTAWNKDTLDQRIRRAREIADYRRQWRQQWSSEQPLERRAPTVRQSHGDDRGGLPFSPWHEQMEQD
jgi:integrase